MKGTIPIMELVPFFTSTYKKGAIMNYVEYSLKTIEEHLKPEGMALIIGAGFNPKSKNLNIQKINPDNIIIDEGNESIEVWCDHYKNSEEFRPVDLVVMSRVLEHFPVRDFDYYLYQIYTIMTEGAKLICVTPDMPAVVDQLINEFRKDLPDFFRIKRLTYELFNEGPHIFDRHALWTSEESIQYYLEKENLFKFESLQTITIDTDIVPDQIEVVATRV